MRALAGQLFTDFASRPVKVPPDGSLRHLHHVGDVIDFTALDFAQHKGRPLLHIQRLGCLLIVAVDLLAAKESLEKARLVPPRPPGLCPPPQAVSWPGVGQRQACGGIDCRRIRDLSSQILMIGPALPKIADLYLIAVLLKQDRPDLEHKEPLSGLGLSKVIFMVVVLLAPFGPRWAKI